MTMSRVEQLQKRITLSLKKWLGLPRNLSAKCLYSKSSTLNLPFSSLTEEFKASKSRKMQTYYDSVDSCINGAQTFVDAGRKANTRMVIEDAKSKLQMQEIMGVTNQGLGVRKTKMYS